MKRTLRCLFILLALLASIHQADAQGTTAFTYQGQLRDTSTNANGTYTMIFALYNSASSGTQIGSAITNSPTLANGLFTVNLDFGAGAFNGSACWLDITISNGGTTQELSPRVQVLPSPYAIYASTANTANNLYVTSGSVSLSQSFPPYGTSSWNVENGFGASIIGGFTNFESSLFFAGISGLPALQIWDDPQAGTRGISADSVIGNEFTASNFYGGTFSGNAGGATNLLNVIPNIQVFTIFNTSTSGGTFVVPTNVTRIMVQMWGGGGGGGGSIFFHQEDENGNTTNVVQEGGGGGGSGGYALGILNVTPGSSYSVIVGTGGEGGNGFTETSPQPATAGTAGTSSSFGGLIIANGGGGGGGATVSANGAGGSQAAPSSGSLFPAGAGRGGNGGLNYGPSSGSGTALSVGGKGGDAIFGGNGGLGGPSAGAAEEAGSFGGDYGSLGGGGGGGGNGGNGGSGGSGAVSITY